MSSVGIRITLIFLWTIPYLHSFISHKHDMCACTHIIMQYFPDRFVRREINNLDVTCPFAKDGCNWEGKFGEYFNHLSIAKCRFCPSITTATPDIRVFATNVSPNQSLIDISGVLLFELVQMCSDSLQCPLSPFGCSECFVDRDQLNWHLQENQCSHFTMLIDQFQLLEEKLRDQGLAATSVTHSSNMNEQRRYQGPPPGTTGSHAVLDQQMQDLLSDDEIQSLRNRFASELRSRDEEIVALRSRIVRLERQIRSQNAELEDRDFRLSLIENSNHDGSMIWKIPQFNQRKADAENGKYTSIFSLPFYSGRYGYKMCLRLYIMGDGIGKGTHLSLFFVVMRGEFDNILHWPFTHKVTFKLINQARGRDVVDTFLPDPMSSSFRKPTSDMNIASGFPRFISHIELEQGEFVVDDTIFIKCMIDTSTIRHP